MLIRHVHADEYDELGQLTVEAYLNLERRSTLGDYEVELRDVHKRAAAGTVLVAEGDGGELLGGVTYVPRPATELSEFDDLDGCGMRMLAVRPRSQGHGVGRALAEACADLGRIDGRRLMVLHSTRAMTVAHGLYEQLGFSRAPGRDVVIDDLEDGAGRPFLLMAFELVY